MHGNAPKSPFTGVPGWLTEAEESLLMRYAAQVDHNGVIVGIGVEYGRSTAALVRASRKNRPSVWGVELIPKPEYALNMQEAGLAREDAAILVGDSKDVGREWDYGKINFLFIDGDHSYEGALGDIQAWANHVAPGGFMAFHDVAHPTNKMPHYLHFEVARAIQTWYQDSAIEWALVETVDTIAVFQRANALRTTNGDVLEIGDAPIIKPTTEKPKRTATRNAKR